MSPETPVVSDYGSGRDGGSKGHYNPLKKLQRLEIKGVSILL